MALKNLRVYPRMENLDAIEKIAGKELPVIFKEFMKNNGGLSHYERIFTDTAKTQWEVNAYLNYDELYKLTEEFSKHYALKLVPFAYDPGGWHFCLCVDETDFGAIFINRWTDHSPNDQFLKIAGSFEEFINGLETEEN